MLLVRFLLGLIKPILLLVLIIWGALFAGSKLNIDWNKALGGGLKEPVSLTYVLGHTVKRDLTTYAQRPVMVEVEQSESLPLGLLPTERSVRFVGVCSAGIDYRQFPEQFETTSNSSELVVRVVEPYFSGCAITETPGFPSGSGLFPASRDLYNSLLQKGFDTMKSKALETSSDLLPAARESAEEAIKGHYTRVLLAQGVRDPKVTIIFTKP